MIFFGKFNPKETILFFYANYDNPVSADDEKNRYVLLGCSLLSGIDEPMHFEMEDEEYKRLKKGHKMKNLPKNVWAMQLHHDYANWGVLLPYKEYLARIEEFPEDEYKLKEMRAIVDEDSISSNFKYVAEEMDDDKCLYLLYKLRKSINIVEDHGFANVDREKAIIEKTY